MRTALNPYEPPRLASCDRRVVAKPFGAYFQWSGYAVASAPRTPPLENKGGCVAGESGRIQVATGNGVVVVN
jgi:hypothetical protein